MLIKITLQNQARTLKKLEHNLIGIKCNVTLSKSEEELFCRSDETNSVCCILIRELRSQTQDLNEMLNCWVEFDNMLEEFTLTELDIQNKVRTINFAKNSVIASSFLFLKIISLLIKLLWMFCSSFYINDFWQLSDLNSIVCCITRKTKDFEESEVAEENCVHREQKQFLQRSEERQTILKDFVNVKNFILIWEKFFSKRIFLILTLFSTFPKNIYWCFYNLIYFWYKKKFLIIKEISKSKCPNNF